MSAIGTRKVRVVINKTGWIDIHPVHCTSQYCVADLDALDLRTGRDRQIIQIQFRAAKPVHAGGKCNHLISPPGACVVTIVFKILGRQCVGKSAFAVAVHNSPASPCSNLTGFDILQAQLQQDRMDQTGICHMSRNLDLIWFTGPPVKLIT